MALFLVSRLVLLALLIGVLMMMSLMLSSGAKSVMLGAPYVPIRRKYVYDLLRFGGLSSDDILYDLGSGDGRVVIAGVKKFGVKEAIGIEATSWPYYKSKFLIRDLGEKIKILRDNFFKTDLSKATFVYIYLFPELVDRLAGKLETELQSGTKVLCPSFPIDTAKHPRFILKKESKVGSITAYLYEKI